MCIIFHTINFKQHRRTASEYAYTTLRNSGGETGRPFGILSLYFRSLFINDINL